MSYYEHVPYRENIPAYAIGALDADEITALEAHLRTCVDCREELAAYRGVSDNLLMMALPPQKPPAALRRQLQGRLPGAQKAPRLRLNGFPSRLAVGLAIVLLLALSGFLFSQVRALQRQQAQLMEQAHGVEVALTMLSYPNSETYPINEQNITGSFLLDTEYNNAVLILRGLPPIREDQAYQVWLIDENGERTDAGLLQFQMDQLVISQAIYAPQPLLNFVGIDMTLEPAGGSVQPTGVQIFQVDF